MDWKLVSYMFLISFFSSEGCQISLVCTDMKMPAAPLPASSLHCHMFVIMFVYSPQILADLIPQTISPAVTIVRC